MNIIELKKQHQKEIDNFEGLFFAFNYKQLKEGLEKVGLNENETNKICSIGAGGYLRKDKVDNFKAMFKRQAKELKEMRQKHKTIKIKFAGIDNWNRACFVSLDKPKRYYGNTCILFSYKDTEEEVLKQLNEDDLCYFGNSFGCEPMGTIAGNLEIVRS